jgi:hypothetical protein
MARLLVFVAALFVVGCQKAPSTLEIEHFVEETSTPEDVPAPERSPFRGGGRGALGIEAGIVALEKIVNTGEKLWNIVEKNRAVTKVSSLYANALPSGAQSGADLEGFSDLSQRSFRAYGKNLYGAVVYDVEYTVMHRYGGNVEGRGRYLDQVTVVPTYVKALWGYTVEVSVDSSPPTNVGTKADPIAALLMGIDIRVSTVLKSADKRRVFEFRGDRGDPEEVGAPATARMIAAN